MKNRTEDLIVSLIVLVILFTGYGIARAQVAVDAQCQTASITEFGNIQVNGTAQFFNALVQQANADLQSKVQTDAAIQAGEEDDEVKIATGNAGMNALSNCEANQQTNQVNGA